MNRRLVADRNPAHAFCMKQNAQKIASMIAADFHSPAGPIPFERLLRKHHRLLAELRESGLTWEQVSRLLASNDVKRSNGLAFPASHLRGVFWRHRKCVPRRLSNTQETKQNSVSGATNVERPNVTVSSNPKRRSCEPYGIALEKRSAILADNQIRRSQPDDRTQALAVMRQSVRARRISE